MGGGTSDGTGRGARPRLRLIALLALLATGVALAVLLPGIAGAGSGDCQVDADDGCFNDAFVEPSIKVYRNGQKREVETDKTCVFGDYQPPGGPPGRDGDNILADTRPGTDPRYHPGVKEYAYCKPAGASVNWLPNGRVLFWNALENTENVDNGIAAEYGTKAINDQSRLFKIGDSGAQFKSNPSPVDGGANPNGNPDIQFISPSSDPKDDPNYNDGSMFCSDQNFLADGRVVDTGGTTYKNDPPVPGGTDPGNPGATELQGMRNTRIYDPDTNRWTQTGKMHKGRWYPEIVSLGNGEQFVASGVQNLLKAYEAPNFDGAGGNQNRSGNNVPETETFDPCKGKWTLNRGGADNDADPTTTDASERSLPLFPRMHLLPNGHVYYNAGGQVFNPAGESYDENNWNITGAYDPKTEKWTDLGLGGVGSGPPTRNPGFRGSTFSAMLPLWPAQDSSGNLKLDKKGRPKYEKSEFLTGGGILGTTPGLAVEPTSESRIDTVESNGDDDTHTARQVEDMGRGRWYSSGVVMPTGEVAAFSGADKDEVVVPGSEKPIKTVEIFNPKTGEWRDAAEAGRPRTYHNSAVIMPDARILIGGHATISTGYAYNKTVAPGTTAPNGHDPSFEIYSPPYLANADERPVIDQKKTADRMKWGKEFEVATDDAQDIDSVAIVRNLSVTHIVDGDQHNIELPILSRTDHSITVAGPPNGDTAPPGPYMLFLNKRVGGAQNERTSAKTAGPDQKGGEKSGSDVQSSGDSADALDEPLEGTGNVEQPDGPSDQAGSDESGSDGSGDGSGDVGKVEQKDGRVTKQVEAQPTDPTDPAKLVPSVAKQITVGKLACSSNNPNSSDRGSGHNGNDENGSNDEDGVGALGASAASSPCLPSGMKTSALGIGALKLGQTRIQTLASAALPPSTVALRAFRYCVYGGGRAYVSYSGTGHAQMVVSVAGPAGPHGVTRGQTVASLRRKWSNLQPLGKKQLFVETSRGALVFGIKNGRVRYVAVVDKRLAGDLNKVRYYLRGVRLQ